MDENNFFEKCVLELCRTTMIKPRQIERSGVFLLDHNGQTRVYRLVSGQPDGQLWRKCNFLMKDVHPPPPALTRVKGVRIKNMHTPSIEVYYSAGRNGKSDIARYA